MDKVIPTNGTSAEDIKYANTVKKMYIDGVDVSECEHYRAEIETKMPYGEYEIKKDKCHYSGIEVIQNCKGNKGCIYKQLKRLQAEYDDLHLTYAGCKTANTGLQELNQKLEQENEKLKQVTNESIIEQEKFVAKVNKLEQENERLKEEITKLSDPRYQISKVNEGYYNRMNTYKQALKEIRDIARNEIETRMLFADEKSFCDFNNILAKINEVIGAE